MRDVTQLSVLYYLAGEYLMKRSVEGKRVVVAGLGSSGAAASLLLREMGALVTASDVKSDPAIRRRCADLERAGIECRVGEQGRELLRGADMVVLSPGIGPGSEVTKAANGMGVEIVGEIELASWFWPGKVAAVTGTNGKTTTACMLKAIMDADGREAVLAGNMGYPFSRAVVEQPAAEIAIVEVSSFQMEHAELFHADAALLLNLAPDHLDRYADTGEYYGFKLRLFSNQGPGDTAVFRAAESDTVLPVLRGSGARRMTFGLGGGRLSFHGGAVTLDGERFVDLGGFRLQGDHNIENALAAAAAGLSLGAGRKSIESALLSFEGLPHRLEFIGTYRGVSFYNDSKATNLAAMLGALSSFSSRVLLIAGGKDKGEDYSSVREAVGGSVRTAFLLGETAGAMEEALAGCCEVVRCPGMDAAVNAASSAAGCGDTVLLSPGCSSLDMYGSFEERGDHFKKTVLDLRGGDHE